jgi:hypothetical protein
MSDLVVTVPKNVWAYWIKEGDPAGSSESGEEWAYWIGGAKPKIEAGERLYIVSWGKLRGYAPVTRVISKGDHGWGICRRGGAVACTIPEDIPGFRGYRIRWWDKKSEKPYPNWRTEGIPKRQVELLFKADKDKEDAEFARINSRF